MKIKIMAFLIVIALMLSGCGAVNQGRPNTTGTEFQGGASDLGDEDTSFGDSLDDLDVYDGYFEAESADISVECVSGTQNACRVEGNTVTFTEIGEDSTYSISGSFKGNIVIDVGDSYKFELELCEFSLVCDSTNPVTVKSGNNLPALPPMPWYWHGRRKYVVVP